MSNRNMMSPFVDPTYMNSPPVGNYQSRKHEKALKSLTKQLNYSPKRRAAIPFNSGEQRSQAGAKGVDLGAIPGPGAYDVNFQEELKKLDQKYSNRYQSKKASE